MGKISINFSDPFGASPRTLIVEGEISIKELSRLLAEELGYDSSVKRQSGGLFKNEPSLPDLYDSKMGVLSPERQLDHFSGIKNNSNLSYYVFRPSALTTQDIWLENNIALGAVSVAATIQWGGNYYPIILPTQTTSDDLPLVQFIFAQMKAIVGIQAMPQGWRSPRWQLRNNRTGEIIDGALVGKLAEKIHHGDLLHVLPRTRNTQDDVVILTENNANAHDDLDIKIGDDLLDSITIEQPAPVKINNCVLELIQGDITAQETDVIVNAAKPTLDGGGGVDGAIHQAAGPALVKASKFLAPCSPGKSVLTPGFYLSAKWVIHTVGPIYRDGKQDEAKILADAYRSSLAIAFYSGFSSISFPAVSTGVYGYPVVQAAEITWKTLAETIHENKDSLLRVARVVVFDNQTYDAYASALSRLSLND